jgi:preprotein translocase subunit YajC
MPVDPFGRSIAVPLAASSSGGGSYLPFVFIILLFGALYFLFIRPQQRRNREVQAMQSRLGVGDEVMTGSGVYGTVAEVDDEAGTISLEVSPGVIIRFARGAVARTVTPASHEETEAEPEDEYEAEEADETYEADEADEVEETHETDDKVTERRD